MTKKPQPKKPPMGESRESVVAELRRLHTAATPGKWFRSGHDPDDWNVGVVPKDSTNLGEICDLAGWNEQAGANAALISESHNALPALLAVVEAAQEFRAEHPAWSPDEFDEDSIGEALRGDDSSGARLDRALAALTSEQKPGKP
jgi:hypothetical protein